MISINEKYNLALKNQYNSAPKSLIKQNAESDTFVSKNQISFGGSLRTDKSFFTRIIESVKKLFSQAKFQPNEEKIRTTQLVNKVLNCSPFDKKAYDELLVKVNKILVENYKPTIQQATSETISCAMMLKNYYDKIYGKGNYKIVSLGRSPELITKALEYSGIEAKYLPISEINTCLEYTDLEKLVHKASNYKKYIQELGLTKEKIAQSDKKIVFVDYTNSGTSLNLIKRLFEEYFKLPKDQITFRSINNDLLKTAGKQSKDAAKEAYAYISKYMLASVSETYTQTPKLPYTELNSIYRKINEQEFYNMHKIFNFHLKKTMESMGLIAKS